jgi:hypothetical protein
LALDQYDRNTVSDEEKDAQRLAKGMAVYCVRNTFLEDLHAGTAPSSKTGDYSDVKVVSPYGEIPWTNLSRLDDDEMRKLMKEVVNKIYTVLLRMDDSEFVERLNQYGKLMAYNWTNPKISRPRRNHSNKCLDGGDGIACRHWAPA